MPNKRHAHWQSETENDEVVVRAQENNRDPIEQQQRRALIRNAQRTRLLVAELADKINAAADEVSGHLSAIKWALWLVVFFLGVIVWRQRPF